MIDTVGTASSSATVIFAATAPGDAQVGRLEATTAANGTAGPTWTVINNIDEDLDKHGYCAKDRSIRQLFESVAYQHDQNGAFHPNTEGHL